MKAGDILTLTGLSKKGRERIKRDGSTGWVVVQTADNVMFSQEKGPWLLVQNSTPVSMRWIHETHDADFIIERD